jgi:tight adherence protein B
MSNLMIFGCLFALLAIAVIFLSANSERDKLMKRVDRMKKRGAGRSTLQAMSLQDMSLRRKTGDTQGFIYLLTKPLPSFNNIGVQLEKAGKTITPKQYMLRRLLTMVLITLVLWVLLKKSIVISVIAGLVIGVWIPLKLLKRSSTQYSKAFLRLFPDAIDLIVRGLRSGLPVSESLTLVTQEVPDPVGNVFGTIANTMKLGVPLEKALQETAKKLDMTEFNFFTTSIVLQRETGGNLSEVLNNLSEVLRSRFIMRMKIHAMSSEARASSYIIGALPIVVFTLVMIVSPEYMRPLWTDSRGNICAGIAVGMLTFGMWVMRRMSQFEI